MRGRGRAGWREGAERGRGETEPSVPVTFFSIYFLVGLATLLLMSPILYFWEMSGFEPREVP